MSKVQLTYDDEQHGTALKEPRHRSVVIGCARSGEEIEEFSAGDLVGIGVAGCMLFSMATLARRDGLDIKGTVVDIEFTVTETPFPHLDSITLVFNLLRDFAPEDRKKLERASEQCPIKASFRPETIVTAKFNYAKETPAAG